MAGVKISGLPAVTVAQLTDFYPVVQGGVTKRETVTQLLSIINSNITGFLPISGGTLTGPLILNADPTLPLGAATKEYVDQFAAGITVVLSCAAATTANLNATQAGAGIGATLTNAGAQVAFAVDGYSANLNDRILVKNQTLTQHNGIYSVTTVGTGATNWVLTRTTDYDTAAQIKPGTLVAINNGTLNATTSWLETATVVTVDTDPVLFSQFTFGPTSFLLRSNNLSDLISAPTALVNLGLGTPSGTGNVILQTSPTLISPTLGAASATSLTFSSTSGIIGTTTNNNAAAGSVGELISSIVAFSSSISLVTATPTNLTSISLTAGDWNVWGNLFFNFSAVGFSSYSGWSSATSATLPDESLYNNSIVLASATSGTAFNIPQRRYSLAVNTTIYLSVLASFSATCTVCGAIYARRVR